MADDAKPTKELQAFAQHYELPTRLLDWSESPYIAAFFAFKDCLLAKEQSENVAIWALDRRAPIWTEDHGATLEEIDGPSNERMLNQRGLFTVATFSHACLEEYVESFDDLRPGTLIQFTIPSRIAALALEELSAMGLTETRLYPEPDGCARSVLLRYHLESLPSQRPEILIEYADPLGSPIHAQSAGCRFSPEASQMKSEQYLLIIGRRGSGKSYRLNALRERHRQSGFHCTEIETVPLATELVHKVWSSHDNIDGGHTWERLWQCAILRSTISYIKHDVTLKQLNSLLNVDKYSNLLSTYARPLGPYGQLSDMIASHAEQGLSQLFQSSEWDSLTDDLRRALADKSLYFYIDSFEDVFSGDPLHWQECQKSLLDFAKTRLCELKLNLRFVIAIQDTTFLSWVGTNQTKLVDNCRHEIWTKERLTDFIKERLAAMPAKYWRGQKTFPKSFEEWFQMDTIRNERREIDEVLTEYLMRHSRMLPRDLIRLGNAVYESLLRNETNAGDQAFAIRQSVSRCASDFCREQIKLAAVDAASVRSAPGENLFSDPFATNSAYLAKVVKKLTIFVRAVGRERFKNDDATFRSVRAQFVSQCGGVDPADLLWRHGLIGWATTEDGPFIFCSGRAISNLPANKEWYAFHTIVEDLTGIPTASGQPITANYDDMVSATSERDENRLSNTSLPNVTKSKSARRTIRKKRTTSKNAGK